MTVLAKFDSYKILSKYTIALVLVVIQMYKLQAVNML